MGRSREGMPDLGRTQGGGRSGRSRRVRGLSLAWRGGGGPELERTGRRAGTGRMASAWGGAGAREEAGT